MKIAVVGAGAVGGYLSAELARAGHQVSVVARGENLQAIRANGLVLETTIDRFQVQLPASDDPTDFGVQDLVIVTAKTPALADLFQKLGPLLGPQTPVLSAMNGVFWWYSHAFAPNGIAPDTGRLDRDGRLAASLPLERCVGMIIYSANSVVSPGVVRNTTAANRFIIGVPDPTTGPDVEAIAGALDETRFETKATTDIRREMWHKLLRNIASAPIAVLTGATIADIADTPELAEIARAVHREAAAVAEAHGFAGFAEEADTLYRPGTRLRHKPSMLQDLERGRPMEIDTMIAIVQDFARQSGVATPRLDTLLPLVCARAEIAGCYKR
ncbi:MAG: 2-dehydropantoate 2-reductase [Salinarimonas sp.]|nr:2-dehydropantoate 2-reductase [Salinarimonas sp.]